MREAGPALVAEVERLREEDARATAALQRFEHMLSLMAQGLPAEDIRAKIGPPI